jgi:transcriptional regulator with XRE-family HTH domain
VELAASLRKYRLRKGVTQVGAAKEMGVGASMLRDWEFGVTIPSAVNFITWTRVLGFFVEVVDGEAGSGA